MKKVLILVVSSQLPPYDTMADTQSNTWDSIPVDGVETIWYFGGPSKINTSNRIYFDTIEKYSTMGQKMLSAFEWALVNKDFDYIARVNSSTYVNKELLLQHIQTLPETNLYSGLIVKAGESYSHDWAWGPFFVLSKDVVKKVVDNKHDFNHSIMEDVGLSELAHKIKIPLTDGKGCSIDKTEKGWRCISYGAESIEFTDFADLKPLGHHFYRVKNDLDRSVDAYLMQQLFETLNTKQ